MQIIPPCFCLGVKMNISELMCFESLTSFHISFILYQFKSPSCKTPNGFGIIKSRVRRISKMPWFLVAIGFEAYGFSAISLCSDSAKYKRCSLARSRRGSRVENVFGHVTCLLFSHVWTLEMNTIVNFFGDFLCDSLKYVF